MAIHPVRRMKAPWFWSALIIFWVLNRIPHFERWYTLPRPLAGMSPQELEQFRRARRKPRWRWVWREGRWGLGFLLWTGMLGAFEDEMIFRARRAEEKKRSSTP